MEKKTRVILPDAARARMQTALMTKMITQRELAEKVGVTDVSISRYFRGETAIPEDKLQEICEALDLSMDALIRIEERVVVTMTREQAYAVMNATELLARLYIGQVFTMPDLIGDLSSSDFCERRDRAKDAFELGLKLLLGTNIYGQPDVAEKSIEHERAWAIYATIRHALAWHDHPEGGYTVNFDRPMGYGEPMPSCTIIKSEEKE